MNSLVFNIVFMQVSKKFVILISYWLDLAILKIDSSDFEENMGVMQFSLFSKKNKDMFSLN